MEEECEASITEDSQSSHYRSVYSRYSEHSNYTRRHHCDGCCFKNETIRCF